MTRLQIAAAARASLFVAAVSAFSTAGAFAQAPDPDALTPGQLSLACALPPVTHTVRADALHIVGAQDTIPRSLFSEHDLLIVDGGAGRGVEVGQRYYVRRAVSSGVSSAEAKAIVTAAWIRIVAANQGTAIAAVEHSCTAIEADDYLDPFTAPTVSTAALKVDRSGDPDFSTLGRVLFGEDARYAGGAGEYMVIDRGAGQGLVPGARFAIYRDVKDWMRIGEPRAPAPLTSIGEGVVVTTSDSLAVMKIVAARDAVQRGDYVVPRASAR